MILLRRAAVMIFYWLLCWPPAHAAQPPSAALSAQTFKRWERAAARLQETALGRRLIVETKDVLLRENPGSAGSASVRYVRREGPMLLFCPQRLKALGDAELELALVRELSRAGANLPIPLAEGEMAAYQAELEYAMDRAATDEAFSRRLRRAYGQAQNSVEAVEAEQRRVKALLPEGERLDLPPLKIPSGEFERLGVYIFLFVRDPDEFYWAVEQGLRRGPATIRLAELEDFMERYGPDFGSARLGPGGHYARVNGRRYPPALLEAARGLVESGGLARIREALGSFEIARAPALKIKVNAWVRNAP